MRKNLIIGIIIMGISISLISCNKDIESINRIDSVQEEKDKIENTDVNKKMIVQELASDRYEGRLVGSEGNKLAEEYLYTKFEEFDLKPVLNNSLYHEYTQEVNKNYGPVEDESTQIKAVNNIVGKIEGKNNNNAIIVSAHFDNIGILNGKVVSGAIDNASGIAVLLDLISNLKGKELDSDIIFCAFNGEETGLSGSREFVDDIKDKYESMININIDSVGYENGGAMIFFGKKNYEDIYSLMEKSLKLNNIEVNKNSKLKGIADSKSFESNEIPNICLIDENVKDIIHTVNDTPDKIDYDKLDNIVKAIINFITKYKF